MNSDYEIPNFQAILNKVLPCHRSGFGKASPEAPATFEQTVINDAGETFVLKVRILRRLGQRNRITIVGMINNDIKAYQNWNVGLRYAAKYGTLGGFIARDTVGVALAFDQLMSQIGQ